MTRATARVAWVAGPGILYIFQKMKTSLNFQCLSFVRTESSGWDWSGQQHCANGLMLDCWVWVEAEIPFRLEILFLFFSQTVIAFWIPFEP